MFLGIFGSFLLTDGGVWGSEPWVHRPRSRVDMRGRMGTDGFLSALHGQVLSQDMISRPGVMSKARVTGRRKDRKGRRWWLASYLIEW